MNNLSPTKTYLEEHQIKFHISEHSSLRNEILLYSRQCREALIYTFIGNATVIAWLASDGYDKKNISSLAMIGAWLPFLITIIGWTFYHYARRDMLRLAQYIRFLEKKLTDTRNNLGWETYLEANFHRPAPERQENSFLSKLSAYIKTHILRSNTYYNALFTILLLGSCWTGTLITLRFANIS